MPVDNSGSAILPPFAFISERSLGWYRSGVSTIAQSYGTCSVPNLLSQGGAFCFGNIGGKTRLQGTGKGFALFGSDDGYGFLQCSSVSAENGTAILPSYAYQSEVSLGWYRSGVSTVALSYGSLNLNQARLISIRTAASLDSTSLVTNEMAFQIVAGSVATLAIRSGGTIYYFASSASTKG